MGRYEFFAAFSELPANSLFTTADKMAIDAILYHKLVVSALLDDLAVIDNEYPVGVAHGFQPVGDHNDRLIVGQFCNGLHLICHSLGCDGVGNDGAAKGGQHL